MGMTMKIMINDMAASPAAIDSLRQSLIEMRDEMLLAGNFEGVVRLSHTISIMGQVVRQMTDDADPLAHLVNGFSEALLSKLRYAKEKYGYDNNWLRPGWQDELNRELCRHVEKGDPIDVAAYCAFAWHHGWPLTAQCKRCGNTGVADFNGYEHPCRCGRGAKHHV
jgi:hypothetical protein